MMTGAGLERVRTAGAARPARRAEHDRRALVMRLVSQNIGRAEIDVFLPGALKFGSIALRAMVAQEFPIAANAGFDEIFRGLLEDRPSLFAVAGEQRIAAPAVELRRKFPAEIDDIVEPVVEAIGAVRRMGMRGVARYEDAAGTVSLGYGDLQVPETDVIKIAGEWKAGRFLQQSMKVEIVARGVRRHRRVEEPAFADVDAAEKLPVAVQRGMNDPIGGTRRKTLEPLVKPARAK